MIALIAAVPLETDLLRRALSPCRVHHYGHLECYRGTLDGQPVALAHCGIGKANAAAGTAILLHSIRPALVVNFGCGGAYPTGELTVGDVALASEEIYGDEGVAVPQGFLDLEALGLPLAQQGGRRYFNRLPVDGDLLLRCRRIFEEAATENGNRFAVGPFVTVSTCSGTDLQAAELRRRCAGLCENMEGAAIAQICLRYAVPFLELRGISNLTEDRDLTRWDLRRGAEAAQEAVRTLLDRWTHRPRDPA